MHPFVRLACHVHATLVRASAESNVAMFSFPTVKCRLRRLRREHVVNVLISHQRIRLITTNATSVWLSAALPGRGQECAQAPRRPRHGLGRDGEPIFQRGSPHSGCDLFVCDLHPGNRFRI